MMVFESQKRKDTKVRMYLCVFVFVSLWSIRPVSAQEPVPLDLRSIPISDWLNGGDHADIPWTFAVRTPYLRVDQRIEVVYSARISSKNLNRLGDTHELFLISRISSPDGEWLNQPQIAQHTAEHLPPNGEVEFQMRFVAQPGDYLLWCVFYDRGSGKHDVAKRRVRVPELRGDPLPDLYSRMPLVEFPQVFEASSNAMVGFRGVLYLPVRNKRPLQVELISLLSPGEQWTGRTRMLRAHNDDTLGALAALSEMELTNGSISITGLDLTRRQVMFEQRDFHHLEWDSLMAAMKKSQSPDISAEALQGSKNNGAFFRETLSQRLGAELPGDAMRVVIVITSPQLFESGADLRPLQLESGCNCRLYYLRFRLSLNDVFDQLDKFMKPLRPRIFNLISPRDLRKAVAEIVDDLQKF
jgi:hypothetical protein